MKTRAAILQQAEAIRPYAQSEPLAIAEIALASGFENRCAFSRLFRERFGVTAGAMRRGDSAQSVSHSAAGF